MARILVTDGERRSSLAVVRSLGKAGHEVHVLSYGGRSLAGASRHCRAEHRVPDPARSASAHEEAVDRLVARRDIEVVVPTTDASAFLVPGLRREHPHVTVVFPAYEAYREASDKRRVLELASELGIPTPRQIVLERRAFHERGAPRHLDRLGYPLVLKPHRSVVRARDRIVQVAVRGARSRAELGGVLGGFPAPAWPILAQERIAGAGLGVFLLVHRGRTVAAFAHRRLREKPPTGGVSVYRESLALSEELRDRSERLLGALGWSGVAMVEFKLDDRSGEPCLMEVNGRFWGSLQLAVDAGVDFPSLLVRCALGERVEPVTHYRTDVRSRWLWGDVDHLLWVLHASRATRRAHPSLPGRIRALASFLVPWRPGDRFEVFELRDPRPFLRESGLWMRSVVRRAVRRMEESRNGTRVPPGRPGRGGLSRARARPRAR